MREETLKGVMHITQYLDEINLQEKLVRSITQLYSTDTDPSIRTNSVIFLGRLNDQLKATTRLRLCLPLYLKACKDPFVHCR